MRGEAFGETTDSFSERFHQLQDTVGTQAVHNIPIFVEGQFWGAVGTDHCREKKLLTEAELAAFKTAANCIGNAIERDRTRKNREAAAKARAEELSQVNGVLKDSLSRLASEPDLNVFLGHVIDSINQAVGAAKGHVFLHDADANTLKLQLSVQQGTVHIGATDDEPRLFHLAFPADITPAYPEMCKAGEIVLFSLIQETPAIWPGNAEWHRRCGHVEAAAVALRSGDRPIGMLGLSFTEPVAITDEEKALINALADQAAVAIDLARLAEENKQTAVVREREAAARARAAELELHNQALAERDRILEATAAAANIMLTEDDFDSAVNDALQIIGAGLKVDRVLLGQYFEPSSEQEFSFQFLYEWASPNTSLQVEHPELSKISDEGIEEIIDSLRTGKVFGGIVDEMSEPFRSGQLELGVQSTYSIPILVKNRFWGIVALDDCLRQTRRSEAELEALRTLANCIGSAIEREQLRQAELQAQAAREAAERNILLERERTAQERAAQLEAHNQALAERDRILEASAAAANVMLTEEYFDRAVNSALQLIGVGLGVDRVGLMKNFDATDDTPGYHQQMFEWTGVGLPSQIDHPELVRVSESGIEFVGERLAQGDVFGGVVAELPEPFRSGQQELGVQSTYAVPVMVNGRYWGLLGLDDCHRQTRRSEAELEALMTLANCIGSAIEREQLRQAELQAQTAREAAERNILLERERTARERAAQLEAHNQALAERDRILEATAAAANIMLTEGDFDSAVNRALQLIGVGLGVDRVGLMKHFDATDRTPGYHQQMCEWTAAGISRQIEHPKLVQVSDSGIEFAVEQLARGEVFGGIVEELPEPFRSGQEELGAQSVYAVPVVLNSRFWGIVALDDCHQKTRRSDAELEALRTLANCIGSAIEREQLRQAELQAQAAREAAERNVLLERERAAQERAAQLQSSNEILSLRDRWLGATAAAAEQLLSGDDFESVIHDALRILGEGVGVDRTVVAQLIEDPTGQTSGVGRILYEWDSPFASCAMATGHIDIPNEGLEDCLPQLLSGECIGGTIDDLKEPFKSEQIALGVQSTYIVPILLGKKVWGAVSVDHCREKRRLSETEIAVFQTAASCVGSAIQRDRIRQAREAAERTALIARERAARAAELEAANAVLTARDRWLETTATAANQLLSSDDVATSVNVALATIGENLECDRVMVMEYIRDPDAPPDDLGLMRLLYEWDAKGIAAQMDAPELRDIPAHGIEDWFRQLLAGKCVGGVVAELDEPFRSGQQKLGVQSTYGVPVFVEGTLWGIVTMDHCQEARRLSAAELAVSRTAATCVGSAIYQARVRRDRVAQERARLLSSVAEAANLLLRSADYTTVLPEVVRLLGEAVECDRCGIGQEIIHPDSGRPVVTTPEWEWRSPGTLASRDFSPHSDKLFLWEDAPHIAEKLRNGEVVSTLVTDLPEPDRSLMTAQGNTAECFVPIAVHQQLWGFIAFDNCGEPRLYDEAEISILRVAAESIAAAISRQAQDEALRESNRRFRELLEASNDHIQFVEFNPPLPLNLPIEEQIDRIYSTSQFVEINSAGERDLGMIRADIIGKPLSVMHSPTDTGHRALLRQLIENNWQITNAESEDIGPDGNKRYWLSHLFATEENRCIVRAWGVVNNITSLKQAQLAREEAEKAVLAEREKAAQERVAELAKTNEAISQTLNTLASKPQLSEFLGQLLLAIAQQIGSSKIHLFLYDETTHTLNLHTNVDDGQVYAGASPNDIEFFHHPIPADITPAWQIVSESPDILTDDLISPLSDNIWWPGTKEWHQAQGHVSMACIPMRAGNQSLGFIGFAFRDRTVLTNEQLEFMQALTNQAIVAIQLTHLAEEAKQTAILQEQEKAAQERAAELAKANGVLKTTIDTLVTEPDLSRFLGYVLREIALQFDSPFLEYWRCDNGNVACLELVVINGDILTGVNIAGHHGVQGLRVPPDAIDADTLFQRTQHTEYTISPTDNFVGPFYDNIYQWCQNRDVDLPGKAINFPVVLDKKSFGAIAIFLPSDRVLAEETIELGYALTNQAALALQLTQLAEEARQTAILQEQERAAQERAAQLTRSNQALKSSLDSLAQQPKLDAFLQRVVDEAAAQTGASNAHLFLYDAATQTMQLSIATENGGNWREVEDMELWLEPVPCDIAPAFWEAMLAKQPIWEEEFQSKLVPGPHIWERSIPWHRQRGHTRFISAPLVLGDRVLGFLGLSFVGETTFSIDEVELTQALANQATLAIQLTRLAEDAKQTAILQEREKAAQERAAELVRANEAIGNTLATLATNPELDNFLSLLVQELSEIVGAANTGLFLYNSEDNTLYRYIHVQDGKAYLGHAPRDAEMLKSPFPADTTDVWKIILEAPQPITFAEMSEPESNRSGLWWEETIAWHISEGHREIAMARLKVGDIPLGFIGFCFREHRTFSTEQLEFIQALANQATLAIHLTQLAEDAKQAAILQEQERAAQERVVELAKTNEAIAQSLTNLAANPELDPFLGTIIAEMARQLNACKVHLFLYNEPTNTRTQRVAVQDGQVYLGAAPNDPEMFNHPIPADITPGWNAIITSKRPLTYDETQPYEEELWWPESLAWHKSQGHKAITCIPMKAGDVPIGYIGFCFYDRTFLSGEQLEFMQALANQAIVALQLTRLAEEAKQSAILQEQEKAARERAAELAKTNEAIARTLNALTTTPELNEFLGQILSQIIEQIGADDTHLFLYDPDSNTLRLQLAVQNSTVYLGTAPGDPDIFLTDIPADITSAWQTLVDAPKPVTLDNNHPKAADFFWPTTLPWHASRGHHSATCVCMKIGEQPIGFIGFAFCDRKVLTNEQLEFIQALTNQATLAIHLTRLAEQARTNALTDERNRLAREIHDTLAQAFTGVSLQLEAVRGITTPKNGSVPSPQDFAEAQTNIRRARDLARAGLSEARRSVRALRSEALETETLPEALRKALAQTQQDTGLDTHFYLEGEPIPLPEDIKLNLLRIGQEAITNTLRHARASQLDLALHFNGDRIQLRIVDDGIGFDPAQLSPKSGFGLLGIRERTVRHYGTFELISTPGIGTTLEVTIPLNTT